MRAVQAAVAVFVVIVLAIAFRNWAAVGQAAPIDLFVTTVDFSLAALLLIALVVVAVLHLVSVGRIRMTAALESRDLHRELDRARRTATTAEESRIAELRGYLEREIPAIEVKLDQVMERLEVRVPTGMTDLRR